MKVIYRYKLDFEPDKTSKMFKATITDLPLNAEFLKVDTIRGITSIWFLIDLEEKETCSYSVYLGGTGTPIWSNLKKEHYLGSFIIDNTEIYHCFHTED